MIRQSLRNVCPLALSVIACGILCVAIPPSFAQGAQDSSVDINLEALDALKKKNGGTSAPLTTIPPNTTSTRPPDGTPLPTRSVSPDTSLLQLSFRGVTDDISREDQLALDAFAQQLSETPRPVEIASYAGVSGDDIQHARTVAFRRGLNVRSLLMSYGLPESLIRLTVPALAQMGENPQRIDLFVATE